VTSDILREETLDTLRVIGAIYATAVVAMTNAMKARKDIINILLSIMSSQVNPNLNYITAQSHFLW
jgi:hypothetical protein